MKKLLSLLCVIALFFTLCACNKRAENLSTGNFESSVTETADYKTPENYAAVILLKINPEFELYLDAANNVLSIKPLNDDAKTFANEIAGWTDIKLESVIEKIITAANTKGFITSDAKTISISVSEIKDTNIKADDILTAAENAVKDTAAKLKLTITVNTANNTDTVTAQTSSKPAATNSKVGQTNTSSKADVSHKHTYSNATCTEAAKCSCGATSGKAVGHKWVAATCKAPKTCSVCKITQGSKGAHSYKDGQCTVCGAKNALNPKTDLKYDVEISGNFRAVSDELAASGISFHNDSTDGLYCVLLSHNLTSDLSYFEGEDPSSLRKVAYNGKTYYHYGAGQSPFRIELTENEIIVKNSFWDDNTSLVTLKLIMVDANNLKVTYSIDSDYPVGTVLSTNWQSTIK